MTMTRGQHYGETFPGYDSGGGMGGGLAQLLSGIFGQSGKPFGDAQRAYDEHSKPWIDAGRGAINPFSQRLSEMGNGKDFMNNIMGDYQQSPFAKYQQNQAMNAGNAQASANGLSGSTPMADYMQNNARNISSQDMQQYYNNRMGINKDYMEGQNQLMNYGQGFDANAAPWMGEAAAGKSAANNQDRMNMFGGGLDILTNGLSGGMSGGISQLLQMLMSGGM